MDEIWSQRGDRVWGFAFWVGLLFGMVSGLAFGLVGGLGGLVLGLQLRLGELVSGLFGLMGGLLFGLLFGLVTTRACWLAFVLASLWLGARRRLPFGLMGFMDDAYRLGLLRVVRSVYQFRHAALQGAQDLAIGPPIATKCERCTQECESPDQSG